MDRTHCGLPKVMVSPNLRWRAHTSRLTTSTSYIQGSRLRQQLPVICPSKVVTFDRLDVSNGLGIGIIVLLQLPST